MPNTLPSAMDIGKLIRAARKAQGLSQSELSERCGWGFNQSRISHYETGRRMPSVEDLITIAEALNTTLPDLLDNGRPGKKQPGRAALLGAKLLRLSPKRQRLFLDLLDELQD